VDDLDAPITALVRAGGHQYPPAFNATLTRRRFLCHRTGHVSAAFSYEDIKARILVRDGVFRTSRKGRSAVGCGGANR
jgi:hypothetical protein